MNKRIWIIEIWILIQQPSIQMLKKIWNLVRDKETQIQEFMQIAHIDCCNINWLHTNNT